MLAGFARAVERINRGFGYALALLVWATAAVCAAVVVLRYAFHQTYPWMQDLYVWIHAFVFLVGIAYGVLTNTHVRVDILHGRWAPRTRAIVEIVGILLFTLPWIGILAWLTWPFVASSWRFLEGAAQPGGLPGVFLFKTMLLAFCFLVLLTSAAVLARAILVLRGDPEAAAAPPFGRAE